MFLHDDIDNPIFKKVTETISNKEFTESTSYAPCGQILAYKFETGLTIEAYNGGYHVSFRDEDLFSTHSCENESKASLTIRKLLKDRQINRHKNAIKTFLEE